MTLSADLGGRLDAGSLVSGFQADTAGALGEMDAVTLPAVDAEVAGASNLTGAIDLSIITGSVEQVLGDLDSMGVDLPVSGDVLSGIQGALDLAGQLGEVDVAASVTGLATSIEEQISGSGEFLDKMQRVAALLAGDPNLAAARDLLTLFASGTGGHLNAESLRVPDLVPALGTAARAAGGLMQIHGLLEESRRLARVAGAQLDAEGIEEGVEHVERQLGLGTEAPLAAFLRDLDTGSEAQVQAAKAAIASAVTPVQALGRAVGQGMGFGEATVVHLDPARVRERLTATSSSLTALDFAPLERTLQGVADRLAPVLEVDLGSAPASTLEDWLSQLESRVATVASGIDAFDVTSLTAPITQGIDVVMALPNALTRALQELRLAVEQALGAIADAIRAVPVATIADRIREVLAPIAEALAFIGDLVAGIQSALEAAIGALETALGTAEGAVDTITQQLDDLFGEASRFLDEIDLQGALGTVSEQIEAFAQTLAQADMKPYFDTAAGAIDTAGDVIDKVPFELLPDSMEQEVVDVVRPIKQTDVDAVRRGIEELLQIGPDGEFSLRPDLEAALAGIQAKYEELMATVRAHDPRELAADITAELESLAARIETLTPDVAFEPVQAAIDEVKALVESFDLDAQLQPLRDGFDGVLAQVDEFRPSELLAEAEAQLASAREAVFGPLELETWAEQLGDLREQAVALLDPLDPGRLEPQLERVMSEIEAQAGTLPRLELGYLLGVLVSAVLGGEGGQPRADGFAKLLDWIDGESGTQTCAGIAREAAEHIAAVREAVAGVDPQAMVARLQPALEDVRDAVASLPDGAAKTELVGCAAGLEIAAPLAGFATQRDRYLSSLDTANAAFTEIANSGLSEVDVTVARLVEALRPLDFARTFLREVLGALGIDGLELGLQEVVRRVFAMATPARLAGIFEPLLTALKGRIEDLAGSVFDPLIGAITDLQDLEAQLSLTALTDELDAIHAAARGQIEALHPDALLGETVSAFDETRDEVLVFDPLGPIQDGIDAVRDSSVRVLGKLDVEEILATPLEVYEEILAVLEQLDLESLLTPVLDTLDTIAANVSEGLEDTSAAFRNLQDALPDQVGSTSVSASVSVSA